MVYERVNWLNKGEAGAMPANKENMNKMDEGIYNNSLEIETIKEYRYKTTLEADLADNSELTLPAYYKVGTDSLQVYFEGCLLEKGVHYLEVGTDNSISNKIQINNWGEAVKEGYTFAFLIQGSYTEVVSDE